MKISKLSILLMILCIFFVIKSSVANQEEDVLSQSVTAESIYDVNSIDESGITWGLHEQFKKCVECHGNVSELNPSQKITLVEQVPELCYSCHKDLVSQDKWVHGPVIKGECLLCHEPHKADFNSLLKQSIPNICYQCHEIETLELIANHEDESYRDCYDCHENHSSSNKMRLKQIFYNTETGQKYIAEKSSNLPQSLLVDKRESLAGLNGVKVEFDIDGYELLELYEINEDFVRTKVEQYIMNEGIKLLTNEEEAVRQSALYVQLRLMGIPSQTRRGELEALTGSFKLSIQQTVELLPTPDNIERKFCKATLWDTDAILIWGTSQVEEGFIEALEVLVGQFCIDYKRANPINE